MARANRGEFVLETPEMKDLLIKTISRAKEKYSFRVENFCIMNNHVHLIIRPLGSTNLSRLMQWILSVFAMAFNRHFGLRGHVWYDRFRSKVIENIRQYLATFLYIDHNPVKAGIVNEPLEYPYCGIRHIRQGTFTAVDPPDLVTSLLFPGLWVPTLTYDPR